MPGPFLATLHVVLTAPQRRLQVGNADIRTAQMWKSDSEKASELVSEGGVCLQSS